MRSNTHTATSALASEQESPTHDCAWIYYKLTEFPSESGQRESSRCPPLKRRHVFQVPPPCARANKLSPKGRTGSRTTQYVREGCWSVMAVGVCRNGTRWFSDGAASQISTPPLVWFRKLPFTMVSYRYPAHSSGRANNPTKHEYRF